MGSDKWYRGVRTTKRARNAEEEKGGSGRKKMRRWRKRKEQEKEAYRKLATPYGGINLAAIGLREKRRRRKERAFEEEGESGEPRREVAARVVEEAISFIASSATLRPSSPKAGDVCDRLRRSRRCLRPSPKTVFADLSYS
ncbi:hypothetical protein BHE74_00056107 [Ensete ventricosum]|nr:hypothetical protein BHE74_00056107 [Ensete ventricosum]